MEKGYVLFIPADRPTILVIVLVGALAVAGTLALVAGSAGAAVFFSRGDVVAAASALVVAAIGACMSCSWPFFFQQVKLRKGERGDYVALTPCAFVYRNGKEEHVIELERLSDIKTHLEHHPSGDLPGVDWFYRVSYRDPSGGERHLDISVWDFARARERYGDLADLLKDSIKELRKGGSSPLR
ncbi:MAG: hypothetical protein HPY75_14120 [Actinobacteria bacterium]|nr:hypothetical protein [Actinomycetota bacterium]